MRLEPKQAPTTERCKLKRVYPRLPLHVHSAGQKGLAGTASGNPTPTEAAAQPTPRVTEWSPDQIRIRLENELSSDAWKRLESAARRLGSSVEDFLSGALAEAS